MIIGEAPGRREDDSGKPFVGRSGQYLDEVLRDVGLPRERVFITNAVSCRPPDNRTPTKSEVKACAHWLQYQIRKIKPKYVMLLGNVPLLSITGEVGIKSKRGKPFQKNGIWFVPTYHPSYILRGDYKDDPLFRQDFELLKIIMESGSVPAERGLSIKIVEDEAMFEQMLDDLVGTVSFDIETTGLYPWAKHVPRVKGEKKRKKKKDKQDPRDYDARVVSVGFGTRKHQYLINPLQFKLTRRRLQQIEERLEDCEVVGHYAKFDLLWMWVQFKARWKIDFDTGIAHYLCDENSDHGLKALAQRFCGAPNWDVEGDTKKEWSTLLIKYHAHDLYYTRKLKFVFQKMLATDPQVYQVFSKIMMPCLHIFVEAEYEGCYIDESKMDVVEKELRQKIVEAEKKLKKWIPRGYLEPGDEFNWGSTKQLGDLMFSELRIKPTDKTPTGAPSTSEAALKQMDHQMVTDLLTFRGAKQQLSFFIEGWKPYLVDHRLHPSFKLTGTVTGRLSCENPNLQQVPRDRLIRNLIIAPPGWVLIEADLSQIELRIAAELSGDRALIEAFNTGKDPHWMTVMNELRRGRGEVMRVLATASKMVGKKVKDFDDAIDIMLEHGADAAVEIDYAWKELRKKAKAVNFGYLFGMWWKKFKIYAREKYDVILTDKQAMESRQGFFGLYRDLEDWHKRQKTFARRNGYVRYLSGRKRRLPDAMREEDCPERGEAERQAINSPVQGFANELNLMALIQLRQEFTRTIYRPIGTVHDSILAYARADHAERIAKRTLEVMRNPQLLQDMDIELRVPRDAEVGIGPWGSGIGIDKWLKSLQSATAS
jgi:uracil-DNA glycosylase family 4